MKKKFNTEAYQYDYFYIDSVHNMKHRYLNTQLKFRKIRLEVKFCCTAKLRSSLITLKNKLENFDETEATITNEVEQIFYHEIKIQEDPYILTGKMVFNYQHKKPSKKISRSLWTKINDHTKSLLRDLSDNFLN